MDEQPSSPDQDPFDGEPGTGKSRATEPPIDGTANAFAERPRQSFKRRHWGKLLLLTLIGLPAAAFALWVVITLNWSYSDGKRPGSVQKISRKGYICKTWEGMLYTDSRGFRPDSFQFTVRNDSIAHLLQGLVGKQVSLDYEQHVRVPSSCFGDSEYFVVGVKELK